MDGNAEPAALLLERGNADQDSGLTSGGMNSEETAAIGAIKRDLEPVGNDERCYFL